MRFVSIAERVGMEKGLLRGIEALLKVKFGTVGLELMPELRQIRDDQLLGKVLDRLETAENPEEIHRYVKRSLRAKAARAKADGESETE